MRHADHSSYPTANNLRKYRKVRGLTQRQVAQILGLKSPSMVSRWETGTVLPDLQNLFRLAILYRTMVDALFTDQMHLLRADLFRRERLLKEKSKKIKRRIRTNH